MWKCKYCGEENTGHYCGNCGNKKTENNGAKSNKSKGKKNLFVVISVFCVMVIVFCGAYILASMSSRQNTVLEINTDYVSSEDTQTPANETVAEENTQVYEEALQTVEDETFSETETSQEQAPVEFLEGERYIETEKGEEFYQRAESIQEYNDNSMGYSITQSDKNKQSGDVLRQWDGLLNDVYKYLRNTLPKDEFEALRQDEFQWISEKESAQQEVADRMSGETDATLAVNSVGIEYTKDRCYYLISLVQ